MAAVTSSKILPGVATGMEAKDHQPDPTTSPELEAVPSAIMPPEAQTPEILPLPLVERLEQADLDPDIKLRLLEIHAGLKPATMYIYKSPTGQMINQDNLTPDYQGVLSYLKNSGLFYRADHLFRSSRAHLLSGLEGELIRKDKPGYDFDQDIADDQPEQIIRLAIANSPDNLQLMIDADEQNDTRLYGQAYGFPQTAIDAYIDGRTLPPDEYEQVMASSECAAFIQMALSQDHWPEELEIKTKQYRLLKSISPKIISDFENQPKTRP